LQPTLFQPACGAQRFDTLREAHFQGCNPCHFLCNFLVKTAQIGLWACARDNVNLSLH
jgi:hypothetical protein